jgi:hypothetical protein
MVEHFQPLTDENLADRLFRGWDRGYAREFAREQECLSRIADRRWFWTRVREKAVIATIIGAVVVGYLATSIVGVWFLMTTDDDTATAIATGVLAGLVGFHLGTGR